MVFESNHRTNCSYVYVGVSLACWLQWLFGWLAIVNEIDMLWSGLDNKTFQILIAKKKKKQEKSILTLLSQLIYILVGT